MTLIRTSVLFVLAALSAPSLAASVAGDVAAGKEKSKPCAACHGATGNEPLDNTYPLLAGQHADYLVQALNAYKSGKRQNAIMAGFAGALSDQDIKDLAAFYESQDGTLHDLSEIDAR